LALPLGQAGEYLHGFEGDVAWFTLPGYDIHVSPNEPWPNAEPHLKLLNYDITASGFCREKIGPLSGLRARWRLIVVQRLTMRSLISCILILVTAVVSASVCLAENNAQRPCKLTGTWYGGSDSAKFQLTIIPRPDGDDYTLFFYLAQAPPPFPPIGTPSTGSLFRRYLGTGPTYELLSMSLVNTADAVPMPPSILALHGTAQLTNCDTLSITYDLFGGYFWPTTKVPFHSPPDFPASPTPFTETYVRMATSCSVCSR
jgi:hypothetical protein